MEGLRCTVASFGKVIKILLATGHIMTMLMFDVPSDGACFFHCLVAFAQDYEERGIKCSRIPTDVQEVRREICDFLVQNRDNPIFVGETTPVKRIKKSYFPKTGRREHIIDPDYNKRVVEAGLSIAAEPYRVSTFDEYIEAMMSPHAFADEIFVEAAGILYGLTLNVFSEIIPHVPAPIHEKTGDDFLDILVEQGFPVDIARSALLKVNRNLDKAIENLLSQPQLSSEPSEKPPSMFHCQSYNTDDGIYPITILNYQNHYQLILFTSGSAAVPEQPAQSFRKSSVGGAAAVPAQPAQSFRKSSVGGGAAAVPAQPAQSFRKPSASGGGAAVSRPHPPQRSSARGGAAAISCHQPSGSFGDFQPSKSRFDAPFMIPASSLSDLVFSTPGGFFKAVAEIVEKIGYCPKYVEVTLLSIPSASVDSIYLYGSFSFCKGDKCILYRGLIFMFDDGSLIQHDDSVDSLSVAENKTKFAEKVRQYWRDGNRVLSGIQFECCQLKYLSK